MDKKQRELLENLRDIRENLNNDFKSQDKQNQYTRVNDVIFVGEIKWQDRVNGKELSEKLHIVKKNVTIIDKYGHETTKEVANYYLGDKCIGGFLGDSKEAIFNSNFEFTEPDKAREVRELLENIDDRELEENSLENLEEKDIAEIAEALEIKPEDIKKLAEVDIEQLEKARRELDGEDLENSNEDELGEDGKENLEEQQDEKDEQEEEILKEEIEKISTKTEIYANQKVTDKDTMGSLLGEEGKGFVKFAVVYSDKLQDRGGNSTRFSFVGIKEDGSAEKLDSLQQSHGMHAAVKVQQVNRDGSQVEEKQPDSLYTIKGTKDGSMAIDIGPMGTIETSYVRIPEQDNQVGLGVPIETQSIRPTTTEVRELANENRNPRVVEETQRAERHEEHGDDEISKNDIDDNVYNDDCQKIDVDSQYFQNCVDEIWNGKVNDVFTRREVEESLKSAMESNKQKLPFEQVVQKVKQELEYDAEMMPSPFRNIE